MIDQLKENVQQVRERIAVAAERSGRSAGEITLVAVTKYVDAATTAMINDAGCQCLGESRPQVLWDKANELSERDIHWHLIGHLQRNKVKRSIEFASLIHSVDSLRLMRAINDAASQADRQINVLLEVNVSGESAKHGFADDQLQEALETATTYPAIRVRGLMAMAGLAGDLDDARREFASLRELRDRHSDFQTDNVDLKELSMGMSGDFDVAIEEGATIVRVGSLLFQGCR